VSFCCGGLWDGEAWTDRSDTLDDDPTGRDKYTVLVVEQIPGKNFSPDGKK